MLHIGYNHDAVKSMTKEQFMENQKHHANDTDLSADYDRIVQPKKEKAEPSKEAIKKVK